MFLVGEDRQQSINIYNYCASSADEKNKSQKGYAVCQNHIIYDGADLDLYLFNCKAYALLLLLRIETF